MSGCASRRMFLGSVLGATVASGQISHASPETPIVMAGLFKLFMLLPRKKGLTRQQFHDHWRHPHATWGQRVGQGVRHYVQSHQIDTPLLGASQGRFDGVVEIWAEGGPSAGSRFADDPVYRQFMAPDELVFIDKENQRGTAMMIEDVIEPGGIPRAGLTAIDAAWREHERALSIKLLQLVEQDGTVPWTSAEDLELGRRIGALRHVRCHSVASGSGFVGVRELWWPTLSAFEVGVNQAPEAWRTLIKRPARAVNLLAQAERLR